MSNKIHAIDFRFERPEEIPEEKLARIEAVILDQGAVGHAFVKENLRNAFLIGYAMDEKQDVVATVVLKHQKERYRRRIEAATGLDLSGHLERGYTSVRPEWRGLGIAGKLISGLVERAQDQRIYVTIGLDNAAALKLTRNADMVLAASFVNERTGRKIGVFVNRSPMQNKREMINDQ
ncbi:MAG: GNAT family N-acetyltransferase [Desulfobacteraceae bacterium]|nr:MAG: GNAT family N-acetyltransferase [Desulfobacteraceae bacterium]